MAAVHSWQGKKKFLQIPPKIQNGVKILPRVMEHNVFQEHIFFKFYYCYIY